MEFEFVEYKDGTWHLIFEDSLHGNDVNIRINPDGTFTHCDYEEEPEGGTIDDLVDRYTPIRNLYDFLMAAEKAQAEAVAKFERERRR